MPHAISLSTAITMTTTYRMFREQMLCEQFKNKKVLPISETFDREAIDKLLENGAQQLRIYYGMDDKNMVHAILVGVDANGQDILPAGNALEESELIVEQAHRCPDDCPVTSALNS